MQKKRLGRGLDALLPNIGNFDENSIKQIAIEDIDPNKNQPRQTFSEESLNQLADSIKNSGIISPIIVMESGNRYTIVAGERRYRAARIANLDTIPCIIRNMSDSEMLEVALIENIQREDLNPLEQAEAIEKIMKRFEYTQEDIAKKLGKNRSTIANLLRLLNLNNDVKKLIKSNELSFGHARVLAGVDDEALQLSLAKDVINKGLSVRQLEEIASNLKNKEKPVKTLKPIDANLAAFELNIKRVLGVKTKLTGNLNKGRIVLSYNSKEELDNLYYLINKLS
ncbi:MAG: ParB/RepB/Spo0J family partition protein [Christensenellaceae bacterium]|nr:ParB/RepB/Spo0J family partition protein [Christensenellaceae bacterium]